MPNLVWQWCPAGERRVITSLMARLTSRRGSTVAADDALCKRLRRLVLVATYKGDFQLLLASSAPSAMSDIANTANGRDYERKDRPTSDSDDGNVVDHYAPHGQSSCPYGQRQC